MTTERETLMRQVAAATRVLREHCDTVQLFVSRYDEVSGHTQCASYGSGNYFARHGQVRLWLTEHEAVHQRGPTEEEP